MDDNLKQFQNTCDYHVTVLFVKCNSYRIISLKFGTRTTSFGKWQFSYDFQMPKGNIHVLFKCTSFCVFLEIKLEKFPIFFALLLGAICISESNV